MRLTREVTGRSVPILAGKQTRQEAFHLMKRRKIMGLAAFGAVASLALAACGGGSSSTGNSGGGTSSSSASGFNAAVTGVVNPSNKKTTGTISFGNSTTPDSTDPGNTYYAYMWNFTRLYAMPLMTYKSAPGKAGLT